MKSVKEYIASINQLIRSKLFFYVGSVKEQKIVYQATETKGRNSESIGNGFSMGILPHEIVLEPMVVNSDIIPSYFMLNAIQLRSMYNLVCYSYWDDDKWNSLKERSFQSDIKSDLGFAIREALVDEFSFPALN
jgi:hypothetical protein